MADHAHCALCRQIPATCNLFVVGGDVKVDEIPGAAAKLAIVGAPFFTDSLNSSKTLIKRCPDCGTYYEWDYTYEFLAGGSEDDVTLTRLEDEEGRRRAEQMLARVNAARNDFREKAAAALPLLATATNPQTLATAIRVFGTYTQLVQGFDISFAIPALIDCLARMQATTGYAEPIEEISSVFLHATSNRDWCPLIIAALDKSGNRSEEALTIRSYAASTLRRTK